MAPSCPACRATARAGARFCGQCGTALASPAPAPRAATALSAEPAALGVGERKHVTILFADIRGSTAMIRGLDPEEALARIDPVVRAAAEAVGRFGGIVNEVQGDGIMALFGAPLAAEDHPVRACLAASALLQNLPAGIEMRVGVHSGEVVIRPSGRDASDYAAIGPAVYMAKRLEQSADPGTARLSEETALRTRGYTDLRPLGPVTAKGWDEPVPMYELLSVTDRPSWEVRSAGHLSPFVGREAEGGALAAALGRALLGRAQAAAVMADAGMGKSRLVHHFLQSATARGIRVLRAAAAAHAQEAPFHIAAELMRSWTEALPSDDRAALERRLQQVMCIGDARDVDEPAIRSLLDLPLADPDAWAALDASARRQRLLDASRRVLLRGAHERARIVLVEDLHWVDEPSRVLLDQLVATAGAARLLVIGTARPEGRPDWASRSYAIELRLGPLSEDQSDTLLRTLVGDGAELAGLRRRVVEGAEGTPLFLEEIARSLQETGAVRTQPSRVMAISPDQVSIPASVQAIVASRMDRLPAGPRALLLTASVIGKDIRTDVLRRVSRLGEAELQAALQSLEAAEFLYETSPGTGIDYTFKHAVTQSVAYDAILRAERRVLHARVFHALQAVAGDRVDEWTERLCEHAGAGELWEQAVHFGLFAAERARARFAWPEAVRFFDLALAGLTHLPETPANLERGIALRVGMRAALGATGELRRAAATMEEASVLALRLEDPLRSAQLDALASNFLSNLGELDRAVALTTRAVLISSRLRHAPTAMAATFGLGQAHWYQGHFAEAIRVLEERLPDVRGPEGTASAGTIGTASVMILVCLAKSHAMLGAFGPAHGYAQEAEALAASTGQPYDLCFASAARGLALMSHGRHDEAVQVMEAGAAVARDAGIILQVVSSARYLGRAYAAAGRFDAAHAVLEEALSHTRAMKLVTLNTWCSLALAHAHIGSLSPAADAVVAAARQAAHAHGFQPVQAICYRLAGECHAMRGEWAEAAEQFQAGSTLMQQLGMRPERILALRGLAAALLASRQLKRSKEALREADAESETIGLDPGPALVLNPKSKQRARPA